MTPMQPTSFPTNDIGYTETPLPIQKSGKYSTPMAWLPSSLCLVRLAKKYLAQRLFIPVVQIDLIDAIEIAWPYASLGYPQRGIAYAEVRAAGFLVRFEAQGQVHEYHTDTEKKAVLCNSTFDRKDENKISNKPNGWWLAE